MERMSHHHVTVGDIDLNRYYPPTPGKITLANKDVGLFDDTRDLEGLYEISRQICRAASMTANPSDVEAYATVNDRVSGLLLEAGVTPISIVESI